MDYEMLVNKNNFLPSDFIPNNLVNIEGIKGEHLDKSYVPMLEATAYYSFKKMQEAGALVGYHFIADSGYRSYEYQQRILEKFMRENSEAACLVAPPGASEHQTGLALDVALIIDGQYQDDFDDTFPEIKWLHENCHKYGFILRYPLGKENITEYSYEPWHFRYVGGIAEIIKNENLTLEEYYKKYKTKKFCR